MTDEFKQKLLAYLTGKLKKETGVNEPIYSNINTIDTGITEYLSGKGVTFPLFFDIIQGKMKANGELEKILILGMDKDGTRDNEFILIVDKDYKPIAYIDEYTSGVKLGVFNHLEVNDDGTFYGVETYKSGADEYSKRLVLLNNILIPNLITNKYEVKIKKSYYLHEDLQNTNFFISYVKRNSTGSKYLFIGSTPKTTTTHEIKGYEFVINVGSTNEWNIYTQDKLTRTDLCSIAYWDNEDKLHFRLVEKDTENANLRWVYENNNETKKIDEGSSFVAIVRSSYEDYIFKNFDDIYFAVLTHPVGATLKNDGFYVYKVKYDGTEKRELYSIKPTVEGDFGYSSFIDLKTDGENIYVYTTLANGSNSYDVLMGIIDNNNKAIIKNFGNIPLAQSTSTSIYKLNNIYSMGLLNEENNYSYMTFNYNSSNYNGLPYENINSLVPNKVNLYDENNIEIFSKNLYNVSINNNSSISTVQIGNNELNDNTIEREELIGETNTILNSVNQKITKNIYEKVNINFINNIQIKNANNENDVILNINGASRLNESVLKTIDYDNTKATKIRLIYNDETDKVFGLGDNEIEIIGEKLILYDFVVYNPSNKNIKTIEFISNDEKTIYQRINPNLESNKYYNINQFVQIV